MDVVGLILLLFVLLGALLPCGLLAAPTMLMVASIPALLAEAARSRAALQDHAAKVAAKLGLAVVPQPEDADHACLNGTFRGRAVRVRQLGPRGRDAPRRIRFTLRDVVTPLTLPADRRRRSGDDDLDVRIPINGRPLSHHGLLDPHTRQLLIELCSSGELKIADGALTYTCPLELQTRAVRAQLEALSELADRLCRPTPSLQELVAQLEVEPNPAVRLRCALAFRWEEDLQVRDALLALLQRGEEDEQTLAALLSRDAEAVAPERAASLRRLAEQKPAWIIALLCAHPCPEDGLVSLLYCPSKSVVRAAIAALAEHGSSTALQHLRPLTAGMLAPSEVQRAARLATTHIRGRLTHAEPGTLSLLEAEPSEGALSLTDRARGQLSEAIK